MRYLPNLIPKDSRVLPDYFKGSPYRPRKSKPFLAFLGWFFGIFFLLGAFAVLFHPPLAFFYAVLGILLLPPGHNWIEKTFRFRLKTGPKTIFTVLVFACAIPLGVHYKGIDQKELAADQAKAAQEQKDKETAARLEQQRKDSLQRKVQEGKAMAQARLENMMANKKYEAAIPLLDSMISVSNNADLLYDRALCYSQTGNIAEAVRDCNNAAGMGNQMATKLNDQINPVVKHITGYVTMCCDGSVSYAKGRGACSHHGGVCNWNSPVYEESRKYE
jgi:tetratricopeptide (TPR) repeat protein